jgi:hypothetical protein
MSLKKILASEGLLKSAASRVSEDDVYQAAQKWFSSDPQMRSWWRENRIEYLEFDKFTTQPMRSGQDDQLHVWVDASLVTHAWRLNAMSEELSEYQPDLPRTRRNLESFDKVLSRALGEPILGMDGTFSDATYFRNGGGTAWKVPFSLWFSVKR